MRNLLNSKSIKAVCCGYLEEKEEKKYVRIFIRIVKSGEGTWSSAVRECCWAIPGIYPL